MAWTEWEESRSTVVAAYRYDAARGILQIRSRRSGRLRDFDCGPALFEEFVVAPSQGRFLAKMPLRRRRLRLRLIPH
jgi:hypothetical protein